MDVIRERLDTAHLVAGRISAMETVRSWLLTVLDEHLGDTLCANLDPVIASIMHASSFEDAASAIPLSSRRAALSLRLEDAEPSDDKRLAAWGANSCVYKSTLPGSISVAHRVFSEHDADPLAVVDFVDAAADDVFDRMGLWHGTTKEGVAFRPMTAAMCEVACALIATRLVAERVTPSLPITYAMKRMHHAVKYPNGTEKDHGVSISMLGEWASGGRTEDRGITLEEAIRTEKVHAGNISPLMVQIVLAISAMAVAGGVVHNDLHTNNILLVHTDDSHDCYVFDPEVQHDLERCTFSRTFPPVLEDIGKTYFRVPLHGYRVMLIDFGRVSIRRGDTFRYCTEGVFGRTLDVLATPIQSLAFLFAWAAHYDDSIFRVLKASTVWQALREQPCTFCDGPTRNRARADVEGLGDSTLARLPFGDMLHTVVASSLLDALRTKSVQEGRIPPRGIFNLHPLTHLTLAIGLCAFDDTLALSIVALQALLPFAASAEECDGATFPLLLTPFDNTLSDTTPLRELSRMYTQAKAEGRLHVPNDYYMERMNILDHGMVKVRAPPSSPFLADDVAEDGSRRWEGYYGDFYETLSVGPVADAAMSFPIKAKADAEEREGAGHFVVHFASGARFADDSVVSVGRLRPLPPATAPPPPATAPPPPTARMTRRTFTFETGAVVDASSGAVVFRGPGEEGGAGRTLTSPFTPPPFIAPVNGLYCIVVGQTQGVLLDHTGKAIRTLRYREPFAIGPTFTFAVDRASIGVAWRIESEGEMFSCVSLFSAFPFDEITQMVYPESLYGPLTHVEFVKG